MIDRGAAGVTAARPMPMTQTRRYGALLGGEVGPTVHTRGSVG
jgi:hypothetical protein